MEIIGHADSNALASAGHPLDLYRSPAIWTMKEKEKFKSMLIFLELFHGKMCSKIKVWLGFSKSVSSETGKSPFNEYKYGLNNV